MVGGRILGSTSSPMNDFVELAAIRAAPAEGRMTELAFPNATPYRWVKYLGPPGSHGQVAEIEFWAGNRRLSGEGFGTAGSGSGHAWPQALDGDPTTWLEGPLPDDTYVGLALAAGHLVAPPVPSPPPGAYPSPLRVGLASPTPGAVVRAATDGRDPGEAAPLDGSIAVGAGTTVIRAVATRACMAASPVVTAAYVVGGPQRRSRSSMHIGNSLTDTIHGWLETLAAEGGFSLDYARYTIPGAGLWLWKEKPSGGFGVPDVRAELASRPFDDVTFQPFPNNPCRPTGPGSDADLIHDAWRTAAARNPAVQIWVYEQWPSPSKISNCITGGGWLKDPGRWNPPPPKSWEEASRNELRYMEVVRDELARLEPSRPPPYVIPAGRALVNLKREIEAGRVPGIEGFFPAIFARSGTDSHLTPEGRWFVTQVFYACMFQRDPAGLSASGTRLTPAQASALQRVVWETVIGYPWSGVGRPGRGRSIPTRRAGSRPGRAEARGHRRRRGRG
jgi:hypothetical protein